MKICIDIGDITCYCENIQITRQTRRTLIQNNCGVSLHTEHERRIIMVDLKNIPDGDFCVAVTPPVSKTAMRATIHASGDVVLSSDLARFFSKRPIEIRFTKERNAIQLAFLPETSSLQPIVFPKSGRKTIPSAKELLAQSRVSFPVVFSSYNEPEHGRWRGIQQENPTVKSSTTSHSTRKK